MGNSSDPGSNNFRAERRVAVDVVTFESPDVLWV